MRNARSVATVVLFTCLAVALASMPALAAWTETEVRNFGTSDSDTSSLVLSPTGKPYVAWQGSGTNDLFWAKRTATGWDRTEVAKNPDHTMCYTPENDYVGPSATFASDGTPRIASVCIAVGGGSPVLYTTKVSGKWKTVKVGSGSSGSSCDSSATDVDIINTPADKPFITMTDQCTKKVMGFFKRDGKWRRVTMLSPGGIAPFLYGGISLAVDPTSGRLTMALNTDVYGRGPLFIEQFTWRGVWIEEAEVTVTPLPDDDVAFGEPSLAFAADGTGYLAFQEATPFGTPDVDEYGFLALATRTGGVWGDPVTIDDDATVTGAEPSLFVTDGLLHVAYQDVTNGDLRYATSTDGVAWTAETIVGANDTGRFPDLVVTPGGVVHITYHDLTDTALMSTKGP